ncbi:heat-inducible transcriptional repressor HrcA [Brooklawnia cerclae]|uniref:Heat-inducible transcription repressor HrcA n=1 Tax=Brooklawnia cerclae TaxID=349934 RepID=A0ABX0SF79_9ACTN|nr:heat-inducible transcriptional repressor HrcA [Brooklawnia cerclae]NIH57058.1 heat-inducible transcriptional repressor [Brooklawnia cerclae]
MLDERKLEVLRAIITDYVSTHEPVGSKALVERHRLDVSPATVRNDMAVLEDEGYLTQPHTSAGRVPTDKGYRLFVDRLGAIKPMSMAERKAISTFLSGAVDIDDIVHRTVRLLAQLTQQVAIVQYPASVSTTLRHVELVSLTTDRVLVIVIDSTGRVEQRSVILADHTDEELDAWRDRLNAAIVGKTPAEADADLADDFLQPEDAVRVGPIVSGVRSMLEADPSSEVVVAGVPNLTRYGSSYETAIRPVLEAIEEQVVLLHLLGEAVSSNPSDVAVRIGQENPYAALHSTSLVASAYGPDDTRATLGVVGPIYMDYPSTIAAVRAVARYVGRFLAEG